MVFVNLIYELKMSVNLIFNLIEKIIINLTWLS